MRGSLILPTHSFKLDFSFGTYIFFHKLDTNSTKQNISDRPWNKKLINTILCKVLAFCLIYTKRNKFLTWKHSSNPNFLQKTTAGLSAAQNKDDAWTLIPKVWRIIQDLGHRALSGAGRPSAFTMSLPNSRLRARSSTSLPSIQLPTSSPWATLTPEKLATKFKIVCYD